MILIIIFNYFWLEKLIYVFFFVICSHFSTGKKVEKDFELARGRTWNLLLRRQTRYPLRHKPDVQLDNNLVKNTKMWMTDK